MHRDSHTDCTDTKGKFIVFINGKKKKKSCTWFERKGHCSIEAVKEKCCDSCQPPPTPNPTVQPDEDECQDTKGKVIIFINGKRKKKSCAWFKKKGHCAVAEVQEKCCDSCGPPDPTSTPIAAPTDSDDDPDCETHQVRLNGTCGHEDNGHRVQFKPCNDSTANWKYLGCLESSRLHGGAGFSPAEWDYTKADEPAVGIYGWSYYIRAFDLIQDTPVREIGWGQWSKPGVPKELQVCGLHPHGFTCEETTPDEWTGSLKGCGSTDYTELEECKEWCCGEDDKCGVRGSIEGGMGYWMYSLETPHVKFMIPGATNAHYETFGGTFLNDRPQMCTTLGGAVRVANNIIIPNSFIHFDQGSDKFIDGFLGYMLTRTPIGKRSDDDDANYWTIILDALNFSGPVMYMASWYWDSRINWHPDSVSWSDPRSLIAYIAQGFEGSIGTRVLTDKTGGKWIKTNQVVFPKDEGTDSTTTLFTGHSQFNTDWATQAIEPMLSGSGVGSTQTTAHILQTYIENRETPTCNSPDNIKDSAWSLETDESDDEPETSIDGFGIGEDTVVDSSYLSDSNAASCHTRLSLTTSKLDCTSSYCKTQKYIRQEGINQVYTPITTTEVPNNIIQALDLLEFEPTKLNDGRFLGPPAESEAACFDTPGPSDARLFCTRTQSGTWLGYRWYRFIDQPELNQVFASMDQPDRDIARCFMQERIERLHKAQMEAGASPWFDAPQGSDALPKEKVRIDPALLLTPPSGLEFGHVPVPVFERNREMPPDCDEFVGLYTEEPNPLPDGYYDGYANTVGDYDIEVCPANPESEVEYSYPGTIFPYHQSEQSARKGYLVPTRNNVQIDDKITCGLESDPAL